MGPPCRSRAAPVDLTAIGEPAVDEPADSEDDEPVAPGELDVGDDALCPDEPAIPRAAGRFGCEPRPTDGTLVGEVAPDTDGVDTVGVWIAGACTGVVTCGGAGGVTVTGGVFGTVTGGTVTAGTVAVGTEGTVGTVKAGLAWGRASSTTIVATRITASVTAAAPRVQAPVRLVSLSWTRLGHPRIVSDNYPLLRD